MDFNIQKQNLHHAYCIIGNCDEIIKDLEKIFDKELNFSVTGNPDFWYGEYDVLDIEDSRNIKNLHANKPAAGNKKIFVINTNFITEKAQNSMLKLFEEPSGDTHFFLVIPSTIGIIPTLRSRMIFIEGNSSKLSIIDAKEFLKFSIKERFNVIKKLIDSITDEEKSKIEVVKFINSLENEFKKIVDFPNKTVSRQYESDILEKIEKVRQYASEQSPSLKMLLEYIALILPQF